jgi:cytochrome c peroxidase
MRLRLLGIGIGFGAALFARHASADETTYRPACQLGVESEAAIEPIPIGHESDGARVALGRSLFHDPRLSKDNSVACGTCHVVSQGGDDGRPGSVGIGGQIGDTNAPTILNKTFDFRQFWNGRAADLFEQADGPIANPAEMGSSWEDALQKLAPDPAFQQAFRAAYPGATPSAALLRDAIVTYEQWLITPNAAFDRFLCGDDGALSPDARHGYERFLDLGCISCHQGRNVGGNMFQRFGVMEDWFAGRTSLTKTDLGRFAVTGREEDRHVFKVPSLRNVELTAPYFHDGSAPTLEQAVLTMGRVQLGRTLGDDDVRVLVAFLRSLTGTIPEGEP